MTTAILDILAGEILFTGEGGANKGYDGESEIAFLEVGVDDIGNAATRRRGGLQHILAPHFRKGRAESEPVASRRTCHKLELIGPARLVLRPNARGHQEHDKNQHCFFHRCSSWSCLLVFEYSLSGSVDDDMVSVKKVFIYETVF